MRPYLKIVDDHQASKWIRFANLVIDRIFIFAILFGIGIFLGIIGNLFPNETTDSIFTYLENISSWEDILITNSIYILYLALMEHFTGGRTIGKYITGTKAISVDGKKPSLKQTIYRNLARLIPFDAITFLFGTGMHDSLSDTRVIVISKYEAQLKTINEINTIGQKEEEL